MKFLCVECDEAMKFVEAEGPEEGSLSVLFRCSRCGQTVALLTNPWETQLVRSLGVVIGGQTVPPEPLQLVRTSLVDSKLLWTEEAEECLKRVPEFARSMARRSIERYARERDYWEITPEVMDEARAELGL
ncbi:MAG: PCP reductase family protein [Candidatus Bipolaricaulia bacterium]